MKKALSLLALSLTGCQNSGSLSSGASSQPSSSSRPESSQAGSIASSAVSSASSPTSSSTEQTEEAFPFEGVPLSEMDFSKAVTAELPRKSFKELDAAEVKDEEWYIWRILQPYVGAGLFSYNYPEDVINAQPVSNGFCAIDNWVAFITFRFEDGYEEKPIELFRTLPSHEGLMEKPYSIPVKDIIACSEKYFAGIPDPYSLIQKARRYNAKTDTIDEIGPPCSGGAGMEYAVNAVEVIDDETIDIIYTALTIFPDTLPSEAYQFLDTAMQYRNFTQYRLTVKVNGSDFQYQKSTVIEQISNRK